MTKDIRWALFGAWPFGSIAIWEFLNYFIKSKKKRLAITGAVSLLCAVGLVALYMRLKPRPDIPKEVQVRALPASPAQNPTVSQQSDTTSTASNTIKPRQTAPIKQPSGPAIRIRGGSGDTFENLEIVGFDQSLDLIDTHNETFTNFVARRHPQTFEEFKARLSEDAGLPDKLRNDFASLRKELEPRLANLPLKRQQAVRADMDKTEQAFIKVADNKEKTLGLVNSLVPVKK